MAMMDGLGLIARKRQRSMDVIMVDRGDMVVDELQRKQQLYSRL